MSEPKVAGSSKKPQRRESGKTTLALQRLCIEILEKHLGRKFSGSIEESWGLRNEYILEAETDGYPYLRVIITHPERERRGYHARVFEDKGVVPKAIYAFWKKEDGSFGFAPWYRASAEPRYRALQREFGTKWPQEKRPGVNWCFSVGTLSVFIGTFIGFGFGAMISGPAPDAIHHAAGAGAGSTIGLAASIVLFCVMYQNELEARWRKWEEKPSKSDPPK